MIFSIEFPFQNTQKILDIYFIIWALKEAKNDSDNSKELISYLTLNICSASSKSIEIVGELIFLSS